MKNWLLGLFLFSLPCFGSVPGIVFPGPGMPASAGGGGGYSDSFVGSNGTALATHDSNWASMDSGNVVTVLTIQSNSAEDTGSGGYGMAGAMYNASSSDTSQFVSLPNTDNTAHKFVCVRAGVASGSDKSGYCVGLTTLSGSNWTLLEVLKGGTYLGGINGTWADGSSYTIKIAASGTSTVTLSVYIGGSLAGTVTDSTSPYGTGHPGFESYGDGTASNSAVGPWQDH